MDSLRKTGVSRCFGVWKQSLEESCWYKPRKPCSALLYAIRANCSRQTNPRSGCHGLLKNSKNKESLKISAWWNNLYLLPKSTLALGTYRLQQFLRSRCRTGQKHPAGGTSSPTLSAQIPLSVRCEHVLLRALIGQIVDFRISSLQTISSSSQAPLSYIHIPISVKFGGVITCIPLPPPKKSFFERRNKYETLKINSKMAQVQTAWKSPLKSNPRHSIYL